MNNINKVKTMTVSALLCALGIMIPMVFPRIVIGPASFTLTSHVPIFIAMFISPVVTIFVSIITSIGFLIAGFAPVIVLRAVSHIIFAVLGALIIRKNGNLLNSVKSAALYSFLLGIIHAGAEVLVVTYFFFGDQLTKGFYDKGYVISVLGLIGIGGLIHSMVDFSIAVLVWKPVQYIVGIPASAKVSVRRTAQ